MSQVFLQSVNRMSCYSSVLLCVCPVVSVLRVAARIFFWKANPDIYLDAFKSQLPVLMTRFDELIATPWSSFQELIRQVYGYGIDVIHADLSVHCSTETETVCV